MNQSVFPGRRTVVATSCALMSLALSSYALASGWAPFAKDDYATVARGGSVSVLDGGATSVLANDFDIERDPMTAVLTKEPKEGELTLNDNGTFSYRHNGTTKGKGADKDEFRYSAYDGTGYSREVKVYIAVEASPNTPPFVTGNPPGQEAIEGVRYELALARYFGDLDGSDTLRYSVNGLPGSLGIDRDSGVLSGTPSAADVRDAAYTAVITATDDGGLSASLNFQLVINAANSPPFVVGEPPNQEAIEGIRYELALARYFGDLDENDTLWYSVNGLPGSLRIDRDSGILSGTPSAADARDAAYTAVITATDNGGLSASLNFQLVIYADNRSDLEVTASVDSNPVTVGESAQWTITVENLGPADLDEGELVTEWITSGPDLSLTVPANCSLIENNSRNPSFRCALDGLAANTKSTVDIQGALVSDGDYSMIAVALSDDPVLDNNASVAGAQVVAAFSEGPAQIVNSAAGGLASADLDGDGLNDVVATTANNTVTYFNSGIRSLLTPGTSLGLNSGGSDVVLLDWNGDGAPDVVVAGTAGAAARLYMNDGRGNFADKVDVNVGGVGTVFAAGAADFDGDGDSDLVLTGSGGSVLLQSSGGSGYSTQSLPAGAGIDIAVADLNNDTFPDMVIVQAGDRSVLLLINSGNGRDFNSQSLQRGSVAGVSATDVNGDGNIDLLLAIDGKDLESAQSRVLIQGSDGSFPAGDKIGASPLSKMIAGDVDGDSLADIVAVNDAGVHQLYRGTASGGFVLDREQIVSDGMQRGILIDFNNDQSLDLILSGIEAGVIEIHANNGIGRLGLGDRIAPTVALNGPASVSLAAGEEYIEEGATAQDDIDGDLSASIVVSGEVNSAVIGVYVVNYTATDRAGNQGAVVRTVQVGVNEGIGGSGGGTISPFFLLLQALAVAVILRRRYRLTLS